MKTHRCTLLCATWINVTPKQFILILSSCDRASWHVTVHRDHMIVHRDKFLCNKTKQMHKFPKFTPAWNSTCFGQSFCPSSRVYSLYTQQWYMSYRFVDSFRAGPSWQISEIGASKEACFKMMFHYCKLYRRTITLSSVSPGLLKLFFYHNDEGNNFSRNVWSTYFSKQSATLHKTIFKTRIFIVFLNTLVSTGECETSAIMGECKTL
jgi:hypothetical protein